MVSLDYNFSSILCRTNIFISLLCIEDFYRGLGSIIWNEVGSIKYYVSFFCRVVFCTNLHSGTMQGNSPLKINKDQGLLIFIPFPSHSNIGLMLFLQGLWLLFESLVESWVLNFKVLYFLFFPIVPRVIFFWTLL